VMTTVFYIKMIQVNAIKIYNWIAVI